MRALFRLPRAAAVAGSTVFLAGAAHVAAGGALPDPLIMAGVCALAFLAAVVLAGRKISPATMLAVLGTGQFALHGAFATLSQSTATAPVFAPTAGHVHILATAAPAGPMVHVHADSTLMLAAHVLATAATGLLLAKGEAALWALLDWLRPLVRLLAALTLHPAPRVPAFTEEPLPGRQASLRLPSRRGPPAAAAVA